MVARPPHTNQSPETRPASQPHRHAGGETSRRDARWWSGLRRGHKPCSMSSPRPSSARQHAMQQSPVVPTAVGHHVTQHKTGRESGKGRGRRVSQHAAPRPWKPPGTAGPPVTNIGQQACTGPKQQGGRSGEGEGMPACGTAALEAPSDRGPPCHTACGTAASGIPDDCGPPCHSACGTAAPEIPDDRGPPCHTSRIERVPLCHTKESSRARGRQCEGRGRNGCVGKPSA